MLEWRNLVCGVLMVVVPGSRRAQDNGRALLHNKQQRRNLAERESSASVHRDFPRLPSSGRRRLQRQNRCGGSTLLVGSETVVQFPSLELAVDHGHLQLDIKREMKVLVGCLAVAPITSNRTQYDVTDIDGKAKCCFQELKEDVGIELHGQPSERQKGSCPAQSCGKASQRPEANTAEYRSDQPRERPAAEPSWIALGRWNRRHRSVLRAGSYAAEMTPSALHPPSGCRMMLEPRENSPFGLLAPSRAGLRVSCRNHSSPQSSCA